MTELDFKDARSRAILKIMNENENELSILRINFKRLQSEHNVLKRTYLNLLDGHLEIVDGKNKTIKKLREQVKELKEEIIDIEVNCEVCHTESDD